jgi:hypothetical protein
VHQLPVHTLPATAPATHMHVLMSASRARAGAPPVAGSSDRPALLPPPQVPLLVAAMTAAFRHMPRSHRLLEGQPSWAGVMAALALLASCSLAGRPAPSPAPEVLHALESALGAAELHLAAPGAQQQAQRAQVEECVASCCDAVQLAHWDSAEVVLPPLVALLGCGVQAGSWPVVGGAAAALDCMSTCFHQEGRGLSGQLAGSVLEAATGALLAAGAQALRSPSLMRRWRACAHLARVLGHGRGSYGAQLAQSLQQQPAAVPRLVQLLAEALERALAQAELQQAAPQPGGFGAAAAAAVIGAAVAAAAGGALPLCCCGSGSPAASIWWCPRCWPLC